MKKFLVVSLMLASLGGFAAAQELGVSAEVTGKYDLVRHQSSGQKEDPDGYRATLAGAVPVDGKITFKGANGVAGLEIVLDIGYFYNQAEQEKGCFDGDNAAHVWFKPLSSDVLTIKAGAKPSDTTLRYSDLNSLPVNIISEYGRVRTEDHISAFGAETIQPYALIFTSVPVKGLFLGLGWRAGIKDTAGAAPLFSDRAPEFLDNYLGLHFGAGYTIEGIGSIRAQYFGPYPLTYTLDTAELAKMLYNSLFDIYGLPNMTNLANYAAKINNFEAGFQVDALSDMGLTLDVVAKIPLGVTADVKLSGDTHTAKYGAAPALGLIAQFKSGDIQVNGGIGAKLGYVAYDIPAELAGAAWKKEMEGVAVNFSVEPALNIGESITVGADIGIQYDKAQVKNDAQMDLGLGAFAKYTLGAATLQTGLGVNIDNLTESKVAGQESYSVFKLKIPLTVKVAF
jgi:hypothetical protein